MRIILGSQSPRRKEILSYFTLSFEQVPSHFDEDTVLFSGDPIQYALELAQKKSDELSKRFSSDMIITADTVVYFNGKIYNKPKDLEEAHRMMRELSGNWHYVYTAVSIRQGNIHLAETEETKIRLHELTPEQIQHYHSHCSPLDKAAGYAIQKSGSIIVDRIEGCYYNVMGFPVNTLRKLLSQVGIDLWRYLKPF
ncbi:MAG: septum formation protein Maf [Verrucomicrobia bacterium]|nr:septum formation protein Maf [Verrucomicrobiota bacterium]